MDAKTLTDAVLELPFGATAREDADRAAVNVSVENLHELLKQLKEDERFSFDMMLTHTAVDYPAEERIELVYYLYSLEHAHHLMVTCSVDRTEPIVPTVSDLWMIAEYREREVYDLFGVLYDGHPDLRRLFLEDDWEGFPLRKDYKDDFMLEKK